MIINSNMLTMIDTTDSKKIDVHISSNHPIIQLYDSNQKKYTPDWSASNNSLKLTATVYADSTSVTNSATYQWFKGVVGSNILSETRYLTINTNELSNSSSGMIKYICRATYNNNSYESEITFSLVTTGKDGQNGQNGKDGADGKDGTSVTIEGIAYAKTVPIAGNTIDLYSDVNTTTLITGTSTGESYLVEGYLCVYNADTNNFMCTGKIQGPKGEQGNSSFLFIRYADDTNGTNMSATTGDRKYIGFYRSSTNVAPIDTGFSTWGWTKFVGEDAKSISLSANSQIFKVDKNNTITPATLVITPQAINTSIAKWEYSVNGGTFTITPPAGVVRGSNDVITITGSSMTANSISIRATNGNYGDTLTVYKVFDGVNGDKGVDAPIAFLTNEHIGFSANSNGQISGTTVYCNVVAYQGATKVTPSIGTITNLPEGMTIDVDAITTVSNELIIPIVITDNATFGSELSNSGAINIEVLTPINTNLKLTWSKVNSGAKGDPGASIKSTTVTYGESDSASTRPTSWQSTIPIVEEGKYLWTRNVIDYTDDEVEDTVTYTYAKQGESGVANLQIGGRNYILNSANLSVSGLGSSSGSRMEYKYIDVGQSYMDIANNTEVTISFDLEMTVGTANPTLMVYNTNRRGPKTFAAKTLRFTADVGDVIKQRCSVIVNILDVENPTRTTNAIEFYSTYETSNWFKISNLKLEIGNTPTDWTPAIADMVSVTFQLYAPKGYLLTNETPELTLEAFAYNGSQAINDATFTWYSWNGEEWDTISDATSTSLTVGKTDVLKSNVYKCEMTYGGKVYEATATVEDKTDIYESIMCVSSNAKGSDCYWVLYTLVYTDAEEVDPLLGPISINTPSNPKNGDYWYAVDGTNASVQLKKYDGANWIDSTDTQSLSYYWDIINDGSEKIPFGNSSKVQVVSCHDFTSTATLICEVNNAEDGLLTQSSLSLTDTSDPILSVIEPTNVTNGQIWIKPNENGSYLMFVWDESKGWIPSDMDTRSKVYTSRPTSYNAGDLWITASDTDHSDYLQGTLLQAQTYNITYNADDWSPTLRYDQDIDGMRETLNNLSQYVTITSLGLRIGARNDSGELSPFTSLFTSTELSFYQNSEKLLTLANNQLTAPRIVVENELEVQGEISLGNLKFVIEDNGSFSFAVSK